ncbi:MAG: peptide-methionine (S)-S-oxide reductase MsrA [Pirellulaceae bacterium]
MSDPNKVDIATLGGGCFWCTQAVFSSVRGVARATCGYSGGTTVDPTYEQVCAGTTGHAEVVRVEFNPSVISYQDVLQIFFQTHDPTTPNRQGNDIGTQYRSVIFYHDDQQEQVARQAIDELNKSGAFSAQIVTHLEPAVTFYPAEDYHQDYFAAHPSQAYCAAVIRPKLDKFRTKFQDLLDPDCLLDPD